jgi:hypothetical protein
VAQTIGMETRGMRVFTFLIAIAVIASVTLLLVLTSHQEDVAQKGVTTSRPGLPNGNSGQKHAQPADSTSSPMSGRGSDPRREAVNSPGEVVAAWQKRGLEVRKLPDKDLTLDALAGHYSKNLFVAGSNYYLFSDGTYLYTTWADIMPETIYERGTWTVNGGCIHLTTDGSLPRDSMQPEDHVYVPMLFGNSKVRLVGWPHQFSFWFGTTDDPDEDPESEATVSFSFGSLTRAAALSGAAQETLRKELMRRAWRRDGSSADEQGKK